MSDTVISEAAKARAKQLLLENDPRDDHRHVAWWIEETLARFIQEASDAAKASIVGLGEPRPYHEAHIGRFILPEPVDPLVEALIDCDLNGDHKRDAELIRAELAKRGLKIVPAGEQ